MSNVAFEALYRTEMQAKACKGRLRWTLQGPSTGNGFHTARHIHWQRLPPCGVPGAAPPRRQLGWGRRILVAEEIGRERYAWSTGSMW